VMCESAEMIGFVMVNASSSPSCPACAPHRRAV